MLESHDMTAARLRPSIAMVGPKKHSAIDRPFFEKVHELAVAMDNLVDRSTPVHIRQIPGWQEFLMVAVLASRAIYETITYLSRDSGHKEDLIPKPEYGITTSPLVRSLLELLFTIVFVREQPRPRVRWFHHSGWRELKELLDVLRARYESQTKWKPKLRQLHESLEHLRRAHRISKRAAENPRAIQYWPTAMKMLDPKKDYLRKRSRLFLEHLVLRYRSLSQDHHMSGAGIIRVYAKLLIDEKDERRGPILKELKINNVMLATAILLAIFSEINDICRFDRGLALAYCWGILAENRDEAQEMYDLRYRSMVRRMPAIKARS